MTKVKDVLACPVGLPNGKRVMVSKEDTVILNESVHRHNVPVAFTLLSFFEMLKEASEAASKLEYANDLFLESKAVEIYKIRR